MKIRLAAAGHHLGAQSAVSGIEGNDVCGANTTTWDVSEALP